MAPERRTTMTYRWNTRLRIEPDALKILIEDVQGDALKARLPLSPHHPRALLTLLEGVALWSGETLHAALSVGGPRARSSVKAIFGGAIGPMESALVHFDSVHPPERSRSRRMAGVGDFRQLYFLRGGR